MSFKPKLHVTGVKGRNCVQSAVLGGKTDTLEYLHSLDNSLRYHKDNDGNTAMTLAVLHSNLETVKCLVEKLELNQREPGENGMTPFLCAAKDGKIEMMQYLATVD